MKTAVSAPPDDEAHRKLLLWVLADLLRQHLRARIWWEYIGHEDRHRR